MSIDLDLPLPTPSSRDDDRRSILEDYDLVEEKKFWRDLGINRRKAERIKRAGDGPTSRIAIGRTFYLRHSVIAEFLARHERPTVPETPPPRAAPKAAPRPRQRARRR